MTDLVPTQASNGKTPAPAANGADSRRVRSTDVLAQLVAFELMGEEFGVPILEVREIILMPDITPVPQAPDFVEGVINLRGQIIPIVDLRKRFSLESKDKDKETRIVVVEIDNNVLGLVVDGNAEVVRVPEETVRATPALIASSIGAEFIRGIAQHDERMLILIDLHKVFSRTEIENLGNFDQ